MSICRTVFILSEALDEQLKALWFSPFQTDDIETDLDMVCVFFCFSVSNLQTLFSVKVKFEESIILCFCNISTFKINLIIYSFFFLKNKNFLP